MTQTGASRALHVAQILWPSFLVAAALEAVVFSQVDPSHLFGEVAVPDAKTVYSVTFLLLWAGTAAAAALSHWMMKADPAVQGAPHQQGDLKPQRARARRHAANRHGMHHHA